jgi:hypothetical protein
MSGLFHIIFCPASRIGRVGENTSPYLSPLRTGLDSFPIIRLKLLALQNVCLCVRVYGTLYVGGLDYQFCLCPVFHPYFVMGVRFLSIKQVFAAYGAFPVLGLGDFVVL